MQAVGVYLKSLRQGLGLTQEEAASRVGLVAKTVERWEAGKHEPKLSELSAYVRALGGSVKRAADLLVGLNGEPAPGVSDADLNRLSRLPPAQRALVADLVRQLLRESDADR